MKKINIAELLKDCPKGMELDCVMSENVFFDCVTDNPIYPIRLYVQSEKDSITLTSFGCTTPSPYAKCVIFPKGKTTWGGFQRPFKDGDIIVTTLYNIAILRKPINEESFYVYGLMVGNSFYKDENVQVYIQRLATEEEKEKLFQAIKDNGYKWNPETKTLEKLPKFKVGDKIKYKNGKNIDGVEQGVILSITDDTYDVAVTNDMGIFVSIADQDDWELVLDIKPKFKVGNKIKNKTSENIFTVIDIRDGVYILSYVNNVNDKFGYHVPFYLEKNYELIFDITALKPFEKVLVRDEDTQEWVISLFSHCRELGIYTYTCINGNRYAQCIPYEVNKELLGTTNDCDEFYKTW